MKPLMVARPEMGEAEIDAVAQVLRSGWIMQGPRTAAFEADFRDRVGARHACAVSSCTSALHLSLLAVGVRPGDVVAVPTHTFIATGNAVRMCGAEPVLVDCAPGSPNMDPAALAALLETGCDRRDGALWYGDAGRLAKAPSPLAALRGPVGRLSAVIVVHQVGVPADLRAILPLAARHGLPVIEDAACAIGSEIRLEEGAPFEPIGRPRGAAACFSFHPRKIIATGDGGMITTNDDALDQRVRPLREHGMDLGTAARHSAGRVVSETYVETAYNYRMTDLQAAVGCVQLSRLDGIIAHRRRMAQAYAGALAGLDGLTVPTEPDWARGNHQSFVVYLDDPSRREALMLDLMKQEIHTRVNVRCIHREAPYAELWSGVSFTNASWATDCGLILPLNPQMDEADALRVADALRRHL